MKWNNTRGNKYGAHKVVYNGITFASTRERDRYILLKDMEQKGEISCLEMQKCFETLPKILRYETIQLKTKTKVVARVDESATCYHADFVYQDNKTGKIVIEEVKSKATAKIRDYTLRRKLVKLMVMRMNAEEGKELYVFKEIIK